MMVKHLNQLQIKAIITLICSTWLFAFSVQACTLPVPLPTIRLDFGADGWSAERKGTIPFVNSDLDWAEFGVRTIVIDAGHGGHDPGCSGKHSQEKHLALAIAKAFAARLNEVYPELNVILTRDKDVFIPLHERAAIANRARADLFISIHCNAMPPNNAGTRGTETYVMGLHTTEHNLEVAKRENEAILLETDYEQNYDYDPNSPEGHILLSMFQNAYLEQSILFAERVEHHFAETADRRSRGVKQAGFVVLKETAMPSVLVETGFLTNAGDENFLRSEDGQALAAEALLQAFVEYKRLLEGETVEVAYEPRLSPAAQPKGDPTAVYSPPANYSTTPTPAATMPTQSGSTIQVQGEQRVIPTNNTSSPSNTDMSWAAELGQSSAPTAYDSASTDDGAASTTNSELRFCVQLAASPRPLNTRIQPWVGVPHLIEVVQEDDMYKYQVRNYQDWTDANQTRADLQNAGFPDAFIVAYRNGQRISVPEARRILEQR